jgi:zinc protease
VIKANRWQTILLVLGLVLTACTSTSDVSDIDSKASSKTDAGATSTTPPDSVPADTTAAEPVDGSTPIAAPDASGLPSIDDPDPKILIGTLDNGLQYLIRNNNNPGGRVDMRLAVNAGSALEDDSQIGGAHFLEHMLFNGTEMFPGNELVDVLRSFGSGFGADINAYTSYDETVYELTMSSDDDEVVATGLDVLEQWLSAATIDQAQVEAERGVVLDEWRGSEASSGGRIFDALEELFLSGSPYEGRDPSGTEAAINSMDSEPLRRFYDDWYRPDNAAVVVVGDVDLAAIEQGIIDRFSSLVPRGSNPGRPELVVEPATEAKVEIHAEPDLAEGFAAVTLPLSPSEGVAAESEIQRAVLDALAFDIIGTRLSDDALRGDAPFDDAQSGSRDLVRSFDAREVVVSADGVEVEAATQAIFDEYERVRRFGFSEAEVDRAVSSIRSSADSVYAGRDSRQDAEFADEYVRYFLEDEPIPTADASNELINAILDRATPETVAYGFVNRLAESGPHVLVVVPEGEFSDVPAEEVFLAQASSMGELTLQPREESAGIEGDLMTAPDPVDEISLETLSDGNTVSFIEPLILAFENGVTVSLNVTEIVEGNVAFEGRSPGGLTVLDEADIPAADAAGTVVGQSGVGSHDSIALDAFLADKEVGLDAGIDAFTESLSGFSSSTDLEVLFQLIHLTMTAPRVDPVAVEQYLDDEIPYATDPALDPSYAEFVTLLEARYDDPRFLLPTVESLSNVNGADIERVFRDRFGDASDFSFAFSGDFDIDDAIELSRRYLGTLPAAGRIDDLVVAEPPPPAGVIVEQTNAGEGAQASVSFLFTAPATTNRRDDVAAQIVQEVITARLTDTIREELGESYSPFAIVQLTEGGSPYAETYISNTTGPELIDDVTAAVLAQLEDLRANGPTEVEFTAASEGVSQQLDLFNNPQINNEILNVLVDPDGNASFDEFLNEFRLVPNISPTDVQRYITEWLPADQYIEVRVLPR